MVVWSWVYGCWGDSDCVDVGVVFMDYFSCGVFIGVDVFVNYIWWFGLLVGVGWIFVDIDDCDVFGDSDDYYFGFYSGGCWDVLWLIVGLGYIWYYIEIDWWVVFGVFDEILCGDNCVDIVQFFGEVGYWLDIGVLELEFFIGFV